jgi:cobalt-zinc-cadmium efflux system membrane fusion protein
MSSADPPTEEVFPEPLLDPEPSPDRPVKIDPTGRRKWVLAFGIVGILVAAVGVLSLHGKKESQSRDSFSVSEDAVSIYSGSPSWQYVELAQATLAPPLGSEPESARVLVDEMRSSRVEAPLAGRVEKISVRIGDRVREGDRLIGVRSSELVDLSKEREVERVREAAKVKELDRLRALFALKAVPEKDVFAAEQELREEQLGHAAADKKFNGISVGNDDQEIYWLTAPRSGVIVERSVVRGQAVGPDRNDPLLVIADLDNVIVNVDVTEDRVRDLRVGGAAKVSPASGAGEEISGEITYVGEVIDPTRRMVSVRVRVANERHELRPNGYAQVSFVASGSPRIVADSEAVVTEGRKSFVFVRPDDKPESLVRREVVTGGQRDGRVEILDGLAAGETYVSKGAILLLNAMDLAS